LHRRQRRNAPRCERLRPYRFMLDTGAGTLLSSARNVEQAEAELRRQFGDRFMRVERVESS